MKNLLKISLFIVVFAMLTSCEDKTTLVPVEIKEAYGYYAYEIQDSIVVLKFHENLIDTSFYILEEKKSDIIGLPGFIYSHDEVIYLKFSPYNNSHSLYIDMYSDQGVNFYFDSIKFTNTMISSFSSNLNIDGIRYDSVYFIQDTFRKFDIYSSKNYGFIKIWNDTITYKFVR